MKWKTLQKQSNILKILVYYQNKIVKQIKMKQKNQRDYLRVLLGTLSASLLGIMLVGKEIKRSGDGIIRASYGSKRFSKNKYPLKSDILLIL